MAYAKTELDYQETNNIVLWTCLMIDYALDAKRDCKGPKTFLKRMQKNHLKITDETTFLKVYFSELDHTIDVQKQWLREVSKIRFAAAHYHKTKGTHGGKWLR
jgi:hypothetical protein